MWPPSARGKRSASWFRAPAARPEHRRRAARCSSASCAGWALTRSRFAEIAALFNYRQCRGLYGGAGLWRHQPVADRDTRSTRPRRPERRAQAQGHPRARRLGYHASRAWATCTRAWPPAAIRCRATRSSAISRAARASPCTAPIAPTSSTSRTRERLITVILGRVQRAVPGEIEISGHRPARVSCAISPPRSPTWGST